MQYGNANILKQPLQLAISALEKQVPKKVTVNRDNYAIFYIACPYCNRVLKISSMQLKTNYCNDCGQKSNWSEVENE